MDTVTESGMAIAAAVSYLPMAAANVVRVLCPWDPLPHIASYGTRNMILIIIVPCISKAGRCWQNCPSRSGFSWLQTGASF